MFANAPTSVQDVDADRSSDIDPPTMSAPDAPEHRLSADESAFILLVEAMETLKAISSPVEGVETTNGPEHSPIELEGDLFCFGLILTIAFAAESDVAQLAAYVKAHWRVVEPEDVETKEQEKQQGEEPVARSVLEQADAPKAVSIATEPGSVEVSKSDAVLPPVLSPIAAEVERHTDTASGAVPSAGITTNVYWYNLIHRV